MATTSPPTAVRSGPTDPVTVEHWTVDLVAPTRPDVARLLAHHEAVMRAQSPEASCHVKSADDLARTAARFLTVRDAGRLLAVGALAPIAPDHEELKSMHVTQAARGLGAGKALVSALIDDARRRGITRLSLETGSGEDHAAARALYASAGFVACGPYAGYTDDPLSTFMTREI